MANSFIEAFKEASFLNDAFYKEDIRRAHFEQRCNVDECPYCNTNQNTKNQGEETCETTEA